MATVLTVVFLGVSVAFLILYVKSKNETLPRNNIFGFRTRAIMASEETWRYVHRKYSSTFLVCAVIGIILTGVGAYAIITNKNSDTVALPIRTAMLILGAIIVIIVVGSSVAAQFDAKRYNTERHIQD